MARIETEIEIEATPERVWEVLTDFAQYGDWNPFMTEIEARLDVGARARVRLQPPGGRGMTFKPRITAVGPGQGFEWLGHLLVRGLFDGRHRFEIQRVSEDRARFVQSESFGGVLAPLILRLIGKNTERGFESMNAALKARAEAGAG